MVRVRFALMTRWARMIVSGPPHHVTQRGNPREPIFQLLNLSRYREDALRFLLLSHVIDRSYARKAGISLRVATDPNWAMRMIAVPEWNRGLARTAFSAHTSKSLLRDCLKSSVRAATTLRVHAEQGALIATVYRSLALLFGRVIDVCSRNGRSCWGK
jgi:hypothetical protein